MATQSEPLSHIRLRGHQKRHSAYKLLKWYSAFVRPEPQSTDQDAVKVVCISDTHNTRPALPPGDILIHAGDLTENGSFDEVQRELQWLSSQPHRYKILVAGNHDVLLDEKFLERYPERQYRSTHTTNDLDWGSVIYLQDSSIILNFPERPHRTSGSDRVRSGESQRSRNVTIHGSPFTPRYGISAFQYRPEPEFWTEKFAHLSTTPDILVTHGPPKFHLDARDFHKAGCPYLSSEVAKMRPRLHVFGHIHASYGCEDVVLDDMQAAYEDIMLDWGGWETVGYMMARLVGACLAWLFRGLRARVESSTTTFINASIVGGPDNKLLHEAVVFRL